jgi:hypothetical protein
MDENNPICFGRTLAMVPPKDARTTAVYCRQGETQGRPVPVNGVIDRLGGVPSIAMNEVKPIGKLNTEWDDRGSRSLTTINPSSFAVTIPYDVATLQSGPRLPARSTTYAAYTSDSPASLYDVWIHGWNRPEDVRHRALGAVLVHPEFATIVAAACLAVNRRIRGRDSFDELRQQASFGFTVTFLEGRLQYHDAGPRLFARWMRCVLSSIAIDAWRACCPFWGKKIFVLDERRLAEAVAVYDSPEYRLDLLTLIGRIKNPKVRLFLGEILDGKSIDEIANAHQLSYSYVAELLQRGVAELTRAWHRE